jgi:glutathione peroxidase
MTLRLIVLAVLALALPGAALADHVPAHTSTSLRAAFGDTAVPPGDPFPRAALDPAPKAGCPALLDQRVEDLRGRSIDLCAFKGQVLLVVNTASQCGYTPQYKGLEAIYERYRAQGLVVLGFPSNDFGQQEPGDNREIAEFCESNYGVTFPLLGKVTVLGAGKLPLFRALTATAAPAAQPGEIRWNFEKFLIGRDGALLARFPSSVEPESANLLGPLQRALGG